MSAFGVVHELTSTLVSNLSAALDVEPLTKPYAGCIFTECPVSKDAGQGTKLLSFWPYRITRDEFLSNQPPPPVGSSLLGIPPLYIDVWYLVTPVTGHGDGDQLLIEKTLQFVYDLGPASLIGGEANVTFETPGTDELFRLWGALEASYSLSCVFCARHVAIDSLRPAQRADRVLERYDRYVRVDS